MKASVRSNKRRKRIHLVSARTRGKEEEDRFFCIIARHKARLPGLVDRVERSGRQLDKCGADGKIFFCNGTRLYFDIKSTVGAQEQHIGIGNLVPSFLILGTERDETVMGNFVAFIEMHYEPIALRIFCGGISPQAREVVIATA